MSDFDTDTGVSLGGDGLFHGVVDSGWNISSNPNGGYLLSIVSQAISKIAPHPDPISFTTHFLRPGVPGAPCEVEVELVRTGRTLSTIRARMVQEGKTRLEVIAAYADLSQSAGVDSDISIARIDMPAPQDCIPRTGELQGIDLAITKKLEIMLHPDRATPGQSGEPEILGWIRFADQRDPDSRSLLLFCDAFPPSPFGLLGVVGWVPTIELTVHVRRRPAPGWIQGRFRTDDLVDGRMIETGCLWDSEGHLVAESRQVGLVRSD